MDGEIEYFSLGVEPAGHSPLVICHLKTQSWLRFKARVKEENVHDRQNYQRYRRHHRQRDQNPKKSLK